MSGHAKWLNLLILALLALPVAVVTLGRALALDRQVAPRTALASAARVALVHAASAPSDAEIENMVRQALALALGSSGMSALVQPGDTVLIKPNLGLGVEAHEITSWQVTRAVVRACQEAGAGRVLIAESPAEKLSHYQRAGYTTHITGTEYLDLSAADQPHANVVVADTLWPAGEPLVLPQVYLDADVVISVPKLKTHATAGITAGLKNAVGVAPLGVYATDVSLGYRNRFHNEYGIHKTIVQLNLARPPDLVVIDAILSGEGQGPWGCTPKQTNLILVSRDPVAGDAVAAAIMGYRPERVRHVVYAAHKGLGQRDLGQIEVVGAPLESARQPFIPAGNVATLLRATTVLGAPPAALVLDGALGEWSSAPTLRLDEAEQVLEGLERWTGAADASARAWVAYDQNALYLAAQVTDDGRFVNSRAPGELWNGDALELYFSGANQDQAGRGAGYTAADFRLGLGYGQNTLYDIGRGAAVAGAQVAQQALSDGYRMELRIPWAALNGYAPALNREIGLDLWLDDTDDGGSRHTLLSWGGTLNLPSDVREMGVALLDHVSAEAEATATSSATPGPSASVIPSATATHTPTLTAPVTRTATPSASPSPSRSATPLASATASKTPAPSATWTVQPSVTPGGPTLTVTPTAKPYLLRLPLIQRGP